MHAANAAVYNLAHGPVLALRTMQTTLTALALAGRQAYLAHAGDTRTYLHRTGAVTQLTGDHSEAAELLRLRLITAEQAAVHPRRSVLTRAIGASPLMRPDFQRLPVQPGDRFLICTDGLWGEVPADELRAALAASPGDPSPVCAQLLELALAHGGGDNVSHVVIDVLDPGPAPAAPPSGRIGRLLAGLRGGG
jgi:protein phosphatase